MTNSRALLAAPTALVVCLGLAACGGSGSSSGSGTSTQPGGGRGFGFASDPKVAACLKKQGVTLPTGGRRRGNGAPPTSTNGAPPTTTNGQPPAGGGFRGGGNSAQFQKLQKALKACGVTLPQGGPGGAPGGAPPNGQAPGGQQAPASQS